MCFPIRNMSESSPNASSQYRIVDGTEIFVTSDRITYIYQAYIAFNVLLLEDVIDAVQMYDFAERFQEIDIRNDCVDYLRNNLRVEDMIEVYEEAVELKQPELMKICWEYIMNNTSEILEDKSFLTAQYNTVLEIISTDILALRSEYDVYQAVVKWGKENFNENNRESFRELILPLLKEVRFISMNYFDFILSQSKDELLTKDEQLEIYRIKSNYIVREDTKSVVCRKQRLYNCVSSCYRSSQCKNHLHKEISQRNFLNIEQEIRSKKDYCKIWGASIQVNVKLGKNNNTKLNVNVSIELTMHNLATNEIKYKSDVISLRENKNFSETEKITITLDEPIMIRKHDVVRIEVCSLDTYTDISEFIYCTNRDIRYYGFSKSCENGGYDDYTDKPNFAAIIASY